MSTQSIGIALGANASTQHVVHHLGELAMLGSKSVIDFRIKHMADYTWTNTTVLIILSAWIGFIFLVHSRRTHHQKQGLANSFKSFETENDCARTRRAIPYNFISSWRNKLDLLLYRNGDLLGEAFGKKFRTLGTTHALYDKYGLPKVVHTIDPINVHATLASKSQDYGVPSARLIAIGPIGSQGVVMTEGRLWLQNRRKINVGFRGARLTEDLEDNVRRLLDGVASATDRDGWTKPIPVFDTFAFMSLDRSIRHMFGVKADLQAESGEPMKQRIRWKEAFDTISDYVAIRSVLGRKSWMYDSLSFRSSCALLRKLCQSTIEAAIQNLKEGATVNASFVGNLVEESSDVKRIRDVTIDVFIAGHNMTAGVLSWLFLELEQRPDVYEDVRQEVLEMFGTEAQPKADMTWDNLQKCKKLHHCIYESMRLHPTLPNIGRQASRDTVLPTGGGEDGKRPIAVAKGTVVMCSLYLMHRRAEEWGTDAEVYRPERWDTREPGYEYAPFGGGPRVCPGQLFALVEMYYVTARVMQRFKSIKQPSERVKVGGSGAGVLLPPDGVTLSMQTAE